MNYAPKTYYTYDAKTERVTSLLVANPDAGGVAFNYKGEDPAALRAKITALQDYLLSISNDHEEMPVTHKFAKGMYMRELFIPKGSLIVGKIHKQECINIVAKGDISILTETGAARVQAGYTVVSPPGIQKVGYAHEDTVFINVFLTDETDVEKLEEQLIAKSHEEVFAIKEDALCLL